MDEQGDRPGGTAAGPDDERAHAEHVRLVGVVVATYGHGPVALRRLWDDVVASYGSDVASRVWQEALSQLDGDQQT